jgi:ribose transport system ATP-binding protein
MGNLLRMTGITKTFPGVLALNKINFEIKSGEVLGLLGENGAGKSTLVKIIGGILKPEAGSISFKGDQVEIQNPNDAKKLGVSIVHQEHNLIPNLTIADNLFLGREKTRLPFVIDAHQSNRSARTLLERVGLNLSPDTVVADLSVSQRQMVEVAKALSTQTQLLIMDEPTSSLMTNEAEILFSIIQELARSGVAILYISHKMEEIYRLCNRVHILRDGQDIGVFALHEVSEKTIINMMVGRELESLFVKTQNVIGEEVLRVENVSTKTGVKQVSFNLRCGEVLGFAGLVGAGRSEIMRAIFGIDELTGGEVFLEGKKVHIRSPEDAVRLGFGFVPEDRKEQGLILGMSINENISLANLDHLNRFGIINRKKEKETTISYMRSLRIKAVNENQRTNSLSGGNQQKVVLSKWLSTNPKVLILDEPTRGIDVGAKQEIYELINDLSKKGVAIILISSELVEIISMSDRIFVMHNGASKGELGTNDVTQEKIMSLALSTKTTEN